MPTPTFLLLQIRDSNDPMRANERAAFARTLGVPRKSIRLHNLLTTPLRQDQLAACDIVLIGGSGKYSACSNDEWLERALDSLRLVHGTATPTFATCWGFQAFARAMGGSVINDVKWAEVGTKRVFLTKAGQADPVFGALPERFFANMGHEDHVVNLPPNTELLASSAFVVNQAYRFVDRPIYCTQFHPELSREDLVERVTSYPEYIERISKQTQAEFIAGLRETPNAAKLLPQFVATILGE